MQEVPTDDEAEAQLAALLAEEAMEAAPIPTGLLPETSEAAPSDRQEEQAEEEEEEEADPSSQRELQPAWSFY